MSDFSGGRLREHREARNLTQADLGKLTELHQQQVARFETGKAPSVKNLKKLADALEVPMDSFFA